MIPLNMWWSAILEPQLVPPLVLWQFIPGYFELSFAKSMAACGDSRCQVDDSAEGGFIARQEKIPVNKWNLITGSNWFHLSSFEISHQRPLNCLIKIFFLGHTTILATVECDMVIALSSLNKNSCNQWMHPESIVYCSLKWMPLCGPPTLTYYLQCLWSSQHFMPGIIVSKSGRQWEWSKIC